MQRANASMKASETASSRQAMSLFRQVREGYSKEKFDGKEGTGMREEKEKTKVKGDKGTMGYKDTERRSGDGNAKGYKQRCN